MLLAMNAAELSVAAFVARQRLMAKAAVWSDPVVSKYSGNATPWPLQVTSKNSTPLETDAAFLSAKAPPFACELSLATTLSVFQAA